MLRSSVLYAISKEKVKSSKRRFTKKGKQKYTYSVILERDPTISEDRTNDP